MKVIFIAVVDDQLRVYGVQGLRVIDASIMPTITSGNIVGKLMNFLRVNMSNNYHMLVAPVFMIGEKGADMIKELWLQKSADLESRYKRQFRNSSSQSYNNVTMS